jgi:hypothetical protein
MVAAALTLHQEFPHSRIAIANPVLPAQDAKLVSIRSVPFPIKFYFRLQYRLFV